MAFFESILKKVTGKALASNFNSTLFNVSSSMVGTGYTGYNAIKSATKAYVSPLPWCKALYGVSAGLNTVSCVSSSVCLLSSYSCIAPVPALCGVLGAVTAAGGRLCNCAADCMDPTKSARAAEICIDECAEFLTKGK
jgi:hypothetical protein